VTCSSWVQYRTVYQIKTIQNQGASTQVATANSSSQYAPYAARSCNRVGGSAPPAAPPPSQPSPRALALPPSPSAAAAARRFVPAKQATTPLSMAAVGVVTCDIAVRQRRKLKTTAEPVVSARPSPARFQCPRQRKQYRYARHVFGVLVYFPV